MRKRIYFTGFSNGGLVAFRLLTERSGLFAACAVFIATLPRAGEACSSARASGDLLPRPRSCEKAYDFTVAPSDPQHQTPRATTAKRVPMATDQLFLTKLYLSAPHRTLVPRPQLVAKLSRGLAGPLTLVIAPAGYGKTTLVREWRASGVGAGYAMAWLSLDSDDNDVVASRGVV